MENIKQVLEFYKRFNKLKFTINDKTTNQSIANEIYGSIILAIALNSEFRFTDDLHSIIKCIIFDEFYNYNEDILEDELFKQNLYYKEISTIKDFENYFVSLNIKNTQKLLNCLLLYNPKLTTEELFQKALDLKIFNPTSELEEKKYQEIFKFYIYNYILKQKVRSGWDKNHWNVKTDQPEKISEHVVGTIGLALSINSEFYFDISIDEVILTLALHEIGESIIGDITPFDNISSEEKKVKEHEAIKRVLGNLFDRDTLANYIFEFDKRESNNAKFSYYCDKLEADIQAKVYQDMGLQKLLTEQKNNIVLKNLQIQRIINEGAQTAFDVWYEYDKEIYKDSPEFSKILKHTKNFNLSH